MSAASASAAPLLRVSKVTVRFGGLTAVDSVSFDVRQGELLGLIGPNGAGKTTALRSITGVVRATEGSVELDGQRIEGLPIDRRILRGLSLSQQLVKPFREISVLDNVALAAGSAKTASPLKSLLHVARGEELATARQMLERVGIGPILVSDQAIVIVGLADGTVAADVSLFGRPLEIPTGAQQ